MRPASSRPASRGARAGRAAAAAPPAVGAGMALGVCAATKASTASSSRVSPPTAITPTGPVTATSVPTPATIRRSTPSPGASTSFTALSVSTVNSGSPAETGSPSARNHSVTVPDFIMRPHLGIFRRIGMRRAVAAQLDDRPHGGGDLFRARDVRLLERRAERHRRVWRVDALDRARRGCRSPCRRRSPRSSVRDAAAAGCPRRRPRGGGSLRPTRGSCRSSSGDSVRGSTTSASMPSAARASAASSAWCTMREMATMVTSSPVALDVGLAERDRLRRPPAPRPSCA